MRMYALQITEEEMERKRDYAFCDRYRSVRSRKNSVTTTKNTAASTTYPMPQAIPRADVYKRQNSPSLTCKSKRGTFAPFAHNLLVDCGGPIPQHRQRPFVFTCIF